MQQLLDAGTFQDSVQLAVEGDFMPWLMENIQTTLNAAKLSQKLADDVIGEAVRQKTETHAQAMDVERQRLAAIEQAALRVKQEAEEEARVKEMEEQRILAEQARMKSWEEAAAQATGGDPNAFVVVSFDDTGLVLANGPEGITVPEDMRQALVDEMANLPEGNCVIATIDPESKEVKEIKTAPIPGAADAGEEPPAGDAA